MVKPCGHNPNSGVTGCSSGDACPWAIAFWRGQVDGLLSELRDLPKRTSAPKLRARIEKMIEQREQIVQPYRPGRYA